MARWVCDNGLFSENVRWVVQIPRLYAVYKQKKDVNSFDRIIYNIFHPLFECTKNPSKYPQLFIFLQRVIAFDSVDDESKSERRVHKKFPVPHLWNSTGNPPYSYYLYYTFASLVSLNQWRKTRGFSRRSRYCLLIHQSCRYVCVATSRWRGWRHGSLNRRLCHLPSHQSRNSFAESPSPPVSLLSWTNWIGHVSSVEQRALFDVRAEPFACILSPRIERVAVYGWSTAIPLHTRTSYWRILCGSPGFLLSHSQ